MTSYSRRIPEEKGTNCMRFKLPHILPVLTVTLLLTANAWGSEKTVREEIPYFTNKDIQQYKNPAESNPPVAERDRKPEKEDRSRKTKEDHEKEYWCKKTAPHRKKIDSRRDEIRATENELSESSLTLKKKKALSRKLESSKRKLKSSERDLGDLEEEAYRKGIPPGWLRCQFE
jgi:hypothetical protein